MLHIPALERGGGRMVSAHLMVTDPVVPAGNYLFGVDVWHMAAAQIAFQVIPVAVELATGAPAEQQLPAHAGPRRWPARAPAAAVIEAAAAGRTAPATGRSRRNSNQPRRDRTAADPAGRRP
jgi:hypothetical protein